MSYPTLADDRDLIRQYRVHPDAEIRATTTVYAPCCGRTCAADMVMDLRGVSGTKVRPGGHGPKREIGWGCDGCTERMVRDPETRWTRSILARKVGASDDVVRGHRVRERARRIVRRTDGSYDTREVAEQAKSDVAAGWTATDG